MLLFLCLVSFLKVEGFVVVRSSSTWKTFCWLTEKAEDEFEQELGEIVNEDAGGVVVEDLLWRVERLRLEEQNTKRFLKAGPRFLPYDECRKWVQAWNRWDCEEDWKNWIAMGEKRNPYIPSEPDLYYGRLGEWISWEHFLGKEDI
jgi:hypothetical protein